MSRIPASPMARNTHRTNQRNLAVILCTAGTLAVSLAIGSQLLGQVGNTVAVVYKKCMTDGARYLRTIECGIDEEATAAVQAKQKATEEFRQQMADRNKKLTPQAEALVEQAMEERFVSKTMQKVESLKGMVSTAEARIEGLMSLSWPVQDTETLQRLGERFNAYTKSLAQPELSRAGFKQLRDNVYSATKDLQEIAVRKPRDGRSAKPIESIVIRIQSLVATVGTVIGEVEKEGIKIPVQVRTGYEQAKKAIWQAEKTCSKRRPKACRQLWDVLFAIESISEPLCALPSHRLDAYCRG